MRVVIFENLICILIVLRAYLCSTAKNSEVVIK